ncbi:MAG: hypothetical protein NC924_01205 [Candidatus Omnitrophica bacterium]|nr:hypothetical protein [Candidatus Omnitrophota bacterium]
MDMKDQAPNPEEWLRQRIRPEQIAKYLRPDGSDFIDDAHIARCLQPAPLDAGRIRAILDKSLAIQTLTPEETAALLRVTDPDMIAAMQEAALNVKLKVYDNRIITFAPLYLGNCCVNNCLYCGFRRANPYAQRRILRAILAGGNIEVVRADEGADSFRARLEKRFGTEA